MRGSGRLAGQQTSVYKQPRYISCSIEV